MVGTITAITPIATAAPVLPSPEPPPPATSVPTQPPIAPPTQPPPTSKPDSGGGDNGNGGGSDPTATPRPPTPTPTPLPQLSIGDAAVTEGDSGTTNAIFTVNLSTEASNVVTVNYNTITGSAGLSDFINTSGTLTFAPGVTSQTIAVPVQGDLIDEGASETFSLILSSPVNASLAADTGLGTITDDDAATLSIGDAAVTEGNSDVTAAVFTVTLSTPSAFTVSVDAATTNDTALAGSDYLAATGRLTFAPGVTALSFTVAVSGDLIVENNETFLVNLTNETNATIADSSGLGTITNDDTAFLSINDVSVLESDPAAVFTVTLSTPSVTPVTVNFAATNGSAIAGADFVTRSGTLTFAPGITTQLVSIPISNDVLDELTETFTVNLSGASVGITTGVGLGTIIDDDPLPALTINDVSLTEGNDPATTEAVFTVTLSPVSGRQVTVDYATTDSSATGGVDYITATGRITFTAGITRRTITVTVYGDTTDEITETFFVDLSNAAFATILDSRGTGSIIDDDKNEQKADLSISKTASTDSIAAGEVLTYTLTITNNGPAPAQNLVITDDLPNQVTLKSGSVLTGNWVLLMHLDENPAGHTTVIADSSGNSNDGTLTTNDGATNKSVAGQFGQAISFDGVDDYILIPRPITDDFTISFWFNTTQVVGGSTRDWWEGAGLVDADVRGPDNDFGVTLGSGGRILFGVGNPNVTISSPDAAPLNDGQWHHVVATRHKAGGAMILYVDGVEVSSGTGSTNSLTAPPNMRLGSLQTGVASRFFDGLIDEVTIFDRAISAGEVAALASPQRLCIGSDPVVCQANTLAAGSEITFTLVVTVANGFSGVLTNTAQVVSSIFDSMPGDNNTIETTTVTSGLPTLSINKESQRIFLPIIQQR